MQLMDEGCDSGTEMTIIEALLRLMPVEIGWVGRLPGGACWYLLACR